MCETHINDLIRRNFPVKKVSSNRHKKQTLIESEEALEEAKLEALIRETGYTLLEIRCETFEKKRFRLFHR